MENRIEEGDKVDIFYDDGSMFSDVEVLYTPADTGDMWHIKDSQGIIRYINPNCALLSSIVLKQKKSK